ncbi:putative ribonuclease Z [Monocercomonoides exilis]|uniref:putative ribonuclease Z n=1 Tax=Monocercomonoides exilis TaxID=2049356 RepID=UPI003559E9CD|nr:putative ribonuclease Z [Monocercomonoides exilis]|eukprot:MONOS_6532.1-p1 / transcript=MONOS_6532.1 / gene=MONOS_6532 / organism=Monocercomonoides_exilis_PA203 / gene_product=unspecified product / transcript_product=unspecified product / location=Mono_scaffold00207:29050-33894(+) / protein_length=1614 / sequence_SO=supercontig / SO=protein_coding / is_pseudo=false
MLSMEQANNQRYSLLGPSGLSAYLTLEELYLSRNFSKIVVEEYPLKKFDKPRILDMKQACFYAFPLTSCSDSAQPSTECKSLLPLEEKSMAELHKDIYMTLKEYPSPVPDWYEAEKLHPSAHLSKCLLNPTSNYLIQKHLMLSNNERQTVIGAKSEPVVIRSIVSNPVPHMAVSYAFDLFPLYGQFQIEKAIEAGVKDSRMYGKLQQGLDVTLEDGRIVKASDVMGPERQLPSVIIVDCPTIEFFDMLVQTYDDKFHALTDRCEPRNQLTVAGHFFHFTPSSVLCTEKYRLWIRSFGPRVQHVFMNELCPDVNPADAQARLHNTMSLADPVIYPPLAFSPSSFLHSKLVDDDEDCCDGEKTAYTSLSIPGASEIVMKRGFPCFFHQPSHMFFAILNKRKEDKAPNTSSTDVSDHSISAHPDATAHPAESQDLHELYPYAQSSSSSQLSLTSLSSSSDSQSEVIANAMKLEPHPFAFEDDLAILALPCQHFFFYEPSAADLEKERRRRLRFAQKKMDEKAKPKAKVAQETGEQKAEKKSFRQRRKEKALSKQKQEKEEKEKQNKIEMKLGKETKDEKEEKKGEEEAKRCNMSSSDSNSVKSHDELNEKAPFSLLDTSPMPSSASFPSPFPTTTTSSSSCSTQSTSFSPSSFTSCFSSNLPCDSTLSPYETPSVTPSSPTPPPTPPSDYTPSTLSPSSFSSPSSPSQNVGICSETPDSSLTKSPSLSSSSPSSEIALSSTTNVSPEISNDSSSSSFRTPHQILALFIANRRVGVDMRECVSYFHSLPLTLNEMKPELRKILEERMKQGEQMMGNDCNGSEEKNEKEEETSKEKTIEEDYEKSEKKKQLSPEKLANIIVLGTGAAIPGKYRNVSSVYVDLSPQWKNSSTTQTIHTSQPLSSSASASSEHTSIQVDLKPHFPSSLLFDCGDSTYAQLYRHLNGLSEEEKEVAIVSVKTITLSHSHADHCLGVWRFLCERERILRRWKLKRSKEKSKEEDNLDEDAQLTLIGPWKHFSWLRFLSLLWPVSFTFVWFLSLAPQYPLHFDSSLPFQSYPDYHHEYVFTSTHHILSHSEADATELSTFINRQKSGEEGSRSPLFDALVDASLVDGDHCLELPSHGFPSASNTDCSNDSIQNSTSLFPSLSAVAPSSDTSTHIYPRVSPFTLRTPVFIPEPYTPFCLSEAVKKHITGKVMKSHSIVRLVFPLTNHSCRGSTGVVADFALSNPADLTDKACYIFRVAYSGDTRPTPFFVSEAVNSTVLIHEATQYDADVKQAMGRLHSTLSQTLSVAECVRPELALLTHLSQRVPKTITSKEIMSNLELSKKELMLTVWNKAAQEMKSRMKQSEKEEQKEEEVEKSDNSNKDKKEERKCSEEKEPSGSHIKNKVEDLNASKEVSSTHNHLLETKVDQCSTNQIQQIQKEAKKERNHKRNDEHSEVSKQAKNPKNSIKHKKDVDDEDKEDESENDNEVEEQEEEQEGDSNVQFPTQLDSPIGSLIHLGVNRQLVSSTPQHIKDEVSHLPMHTEIGSSIDFVLASDHITIPICCGSSTDDSDSSTSSTSTAAEHKQHLRMLPAKVYRSPFTKSYSSLIDILSLMRNDDRKTTKKQEIVAQWRNELT